MLSQFAEYAAVIGTLVLMEGLLAADNALVLAVLVQRQGCCDEQGRQECLETPCVSCTSSAARALGGQTFLSALCLDCHSCVDNPLGSGRTRCREVRSRVCTFVMSPCGRRCGQFNARRMRAVPRPTRDASTRASYRHDTE